MWLSYHIPKTAGSSLRRTFENVLGEKFVLGVYANNGARQLTMGQPIRLPSHCQLVHGHFRPRSVHLKMFPNAKSIVWLRDPIERIYSLVRHLVQEKGENPQYLVLRDMYLNKGNISLDDMIFDIITNNTLPTHTNFYTNFFKNINVSDFDFVGSVHRYDKDIKELGLLMNCELDCQYINVRSQNNHINQSTYDELKECLKHEYDLVGDYL